MVVLNNAVVSKGGRRGQEKASLQLWAGDNGGESGDVGTALDLGDDWNWH